LGSFLTSYSSRPHTATSGQCIEYQETDMRKKTWRTQCSNNQCERWIATALCQCAGKSQ